MVLYWGIRKENMFKNICLLFISGVALTFSAQAQIYTLEIRAFIDGRDQLIIKGDTLQWHHFDHAAVGRWLGSNDVTTITTTLDGVTVLDHVNWIPDWPEPPPAEIRYEATSSVFTGLSPALPQSPMSVSLEIFQARYRLEVIQQPTALNNYTQYINSLLLEI